MALTLNSRNKLGSIFFGFGAPPLSTCVNVGEKRMQKEVDEAGEELYFACLGKNIMHGLK